MIVVSNTSPIINLAAVEQLELLHRLYDDVIIPQAVYDEIVITGLGQAGSHEVEQSSWIKVRNVTNHSAAATLKLELDDGEAEAIALAVELQADLLLIDERKGRAIAERLNCTYIGLLAVLVEAKHQNLISAVKPVLDSMIEKAGFRVSTGLYERVLGAVSE